MPKEADDPGWLALEAPELAAGEAVQVIDRSGHSVLQGALDAGIALLLGIELR